MTDAFGLSNFHPRSDRLFLSVICLTLLSLNFPIIAFSLSLSLSLSLGLYSPLDIGGFFSLLIYPQSVGLLRQGISPSQGRYQHTEQHKHNKRTQTSMPQVGFEPTIPAFERPKTVHASDSAATVNGLIVTKRPKIILINLYLIC
jgi:hypothetical protein